MCDDSVCETCKHSLITCENPDAENGPGYICYGECEAGNDENYYTKYGCLDYEEYKRIDDR